MDMLRITFPERINVCRGKRLVLTAPAANWCLVLPDPADLEAIRQVLTCRGKQPWAAVGAVDGEMIIGKALRLMEIRGGTRFALLDQLGRTVGEFKLDAFESATLARFLVVPKPLEPLG